VNDEQKALIKPIVECIRNNFGDEEEDFLSKLKKLDWKGSFLHLNKRDVYSGQGEWLHRIRVTGITDLVHTILALFMVEAFIENDGTMYIYLIDFATKDVTHIS